MPSTSVISNFSSAKSYSVSPFITTAWTNPSNAILSDSAGASSGGNNTYTYLLGMRGVAGYLQIPDSATIDGIKCYLTMYSVTSNGNGNITGYLKLVKATDSRVGTEKTQSIPVGSGALYTLGTGTDMWGTTLTAAEVTNSEFGVDVGFNYTSGFFSVSVEQVSIEVFYSYADSTGRRAVFSTAAELRTI